MNIVLGTEQLGGIDWGNYKISDVERGIRRALDLGINRYDTAHIYGLGNSEVRLGKILGSKRYEVEITTKIGLYNIEKKISGRYKIKKDLSFDKMLHQTEKSLKNINLDCIPILLAHWPDELHSTEQVMENLIKIKDKGLAKKIGLSNFSFKNIHKLHESLRPDVVQGSLNLLDLSSLEQYKNLINLGIDVYVYGVLAQGLLTGKYNLGEKFVDSDRRKRLKIFQNKDKELREKLYKIKMFAVSKNISMSNLSITSINYLDKNLKPIIGIKNSYQVEQNFINMKAKYSRNELKNLILSLS